MSAASLNHFFGIDFGTTNSATVGFSVIGDESKKTFYGDDEGRPVSSVVAIDRKDGTVYTGRKAWDKKMELSESCVYISSIKSILGHDWSEKIAGKTWTSVDVAAEVFKGLKENVTGRTQISLDKAVVAIPIGFSAEKRAEVRKAASMAGIDVTSFISEPTAAFYANYNELRSCNTVAVFDWGGGTLDVSVLKNEGGHLYELATAGVSVAGDDIDMKLAHRIHARICRKKGVTKSFEDMPKAAQDLMLVRCERAKRTLSDSDEATVSMIVYGDIGLCRESVEYGWFAEVIKPEVDMAVSCLEKVITDSGVGLANIDRILMVGGSSNLRPLIDVMEARYGDILYFPEESMWNVSHGAAMLAKMPGDYYSCQSVGLRLSDDSYFTLLPCNEKVTDWKKEFYFGLTDRTEEARFVFSGSKDIDESDLRYRSLTVPAYRFLQEKLLITASVDRDLVFSVNVGSTMRPDSFGRIWTYENLKCCYGLPE